MQETFAMEQNGRGKPAARTRTLGLRISEPEYAALERKAWQSGKSVADWARDSLLREPIDDDHAATQTHIFTELVAIELVMMNALEPLLRGEKLSQEQAARIFREVQATKAARAREILTKRAQTSEK